VKDILLPVAHVFALVMMVFAVTMLAPLVLALWGLDGALWSFVISALATFVLGALLWLATRRFKRELKTRDGLMLVALTWVALPAVAGFPLWHFLPIDFTEAYFEAASGLTTTGGTVLSGLEFLPRSINLWRHLLSWLGGMGIIVLAVAILPMLGVGGMQIYRAEMPGPMKDSKLTPRIGQTAKLLWTVYAGLTAACIGCLRFAGMNWFDAVCHGFSALALGGFSTYDASIGHFNSLPIEMVLTVFQILAALNFATHYLAWTQRGVLAYFRDAEAKAILGVLAASCIGVASFLYFKGSYTDFPTALRHTTFNLVSIAVDSGLHTHVDDVPELHRGEFRIDRGRHQNDSYSGAGQTSKSGAESAGAPEHGASAQSGWNRDCQSRGIRGAGLRVPLFHEHRHTHFRAARQRLGFHDVVIGHHCLHQ
jgi:trk system potassium uptake protein TrkH